jgi:hypothetical protein
MTIHAASILATLLIVINLDNVGGARGCELANEQVMRLWDISAALPQLTNSLLGRTCFIRAPFPLQ